MTDIHVPAFHLIRPYTPDLTTTVTALIFPHLIDFRMGPRTSIAIFLWGRIEPVQAQIGSVIYEDEFGTTRRIYSRSPYVPPYAYLPRHFRFRTQGFIDSRIFLLISLAYIPGPLWYRQLLATHRMTPLPNWDRRSLVPVDWAPWVGRQLQQVRQRRRSAIRSALIRGRSGIGQIGSLEESVFIWMDDWADLVTLLPDRRSRG
jgi:hypothetical protein